jgi:hypothetical protein
MRFLFKLSFLLVVVFVAAAVWLTLLYSQSYPLPARDIWD